MLLLQIFVPKDNTFLNIHVLKYNLIVFNAGHISIICEWQIFFSAIIHILFKPCHFCERKCCSQQKDVDRAKQLQMQKQQHRGEDGTMNPVKFRNGNSAIYGCEVFSKHREHFMSGLRFAVVELH